MAKRQRLDLPWHMADRRTPGRHDLRGVIKRLFFFQQKIESVDRTSRDCLGVERKQNSETSQRDQNAVSAAAPMTCVLETFEAAAVASVRPQTQSVILDCSGDQGLRRFCVGNESRNVDTPTPPPRSIRHNGPMDLRIGEKQSPAARATKRHLGR